MTEEQIDQDKLRELLERTAQLPRDIEPPAGAWAAIKAEIEAPARPRVAFWQRPAFLLAASLTLVATSSVITAMLLGGRDAAVTQTAGAPVVSRSGTPTTLAEFTVVENQYISTANELSATLETERMQLSPETIDKLKESLRVIDAAILEARAALAEDPANRQLIEMLTTSYSQKVDLLKRTTEMGRS